MEKGVVGLQWRALEAVPVREVMFRGWGRLAARDEMLNRIADPAKRNEWDEAIIGNGGFSFATEIDNVVDFANYLMKLCKYFHIVQTIICGLNLIPSI